MSTIAGVNYLTTQDTADASSRMPVKALGQQDFLKLLVAQLTSQDPLNPKQDTEFIAQMAQFSALEQSKSMQSDIASLRGDQQMLQAYGLLGQTVKLQAEDGIDPVLGTVSAVQNEAGTPKLMVDGKTYTLDQVLMVYPSAVATQN
ncbi:MAG TPA: flagellar hook capping FlgD N-terminal domain-containing protein [Verrucomicrobiae bacterium]